jgi:hypothetical protein
MPMSKIQKTNPAHPMDGGIPGQAPIERHWAAASDEHRSA